MTGTNIVEFKPAEWPDIIKIGGSHLSEPVTYQGVENLINDAVNEIREANAKSTDMVIKQVEKMCKSNIDLSESRCLAKAFITESVKEKFYENITSTKKAHDRIDGHLLSHKNMSGLIRWLITLLAGSGWIFALIKYIIVTLHKMNP